MTLRSHAFAMLLAVALHASPAAGNTDLPGDYSHTIPLSVSAGHAVVRVIVPRAVYLHGRTNDLRDLRVFDATGKSLPFAMIEQEQGSVEHRKAVPLAVFPVMAPEGAEPGATETLKIETGRDGSVISVTAAGRRRPGDVLTSLVLAMPGTGRAAPAQGPQEEIEAITLTLPPGVATYNAQVALDTSEDMQDWRELTQASITWLSNREGASMERDSIEFAPQPLRYARIRWIEGKPIELAVTAKAVARSRTSARWDSVLLNPSYGPEARDIWYVTPPAVPVAAFSLEFTGQNVVLPAMVGPYRYIHGKVAGEPPGMQLRPMVNTTFYRLMQNGRERRSGTIAIPVTTTDRWGVRPQATVAAPPSLRLHWKMGEIVFAATGSAPYLLAVGRANVLSTKVALQQVAPGFSMRELMTLEPAVAGVPQRQDVPEKALPVGAAVDQTTRNMLLWAAILCGVGALGFMAWRLSRQLR